MDGANHERWVIKSHCAGKERVLQKGRNFITVSPFMNKVNSFF